MSEIVDCHNIDYMDISPWDPLVEDVVFFCYLPSNVLND